MAEIVVEGLKFGAAQIADEVIAAIAGAAALEIDGVTGMSGNAAADFAKAFGVRQLGRGVKVEVADGCVVVDLSVITKFGAKIQTVSELAQKRVKTAVETMTGLKVTAVNVTVSGVASGAANRRTDARASQGKPPRPTGALGARPNGKAKHEPQA